MPAAEAGASLQYLLLSRNLCDSEIIMTISQKGKLRLETSYNSHSNEAPNVGPAFALKLHIH